MPVLQRPGEPDLHYTVDDHTDPWRDRPYLILQHGNGRAGRFWYGWVPYLSRHYRVVRPDARGLGQSPAGFDLESGITLDKLVGDLVALIAALGGRPVHFCGESMGGILGIALAARHPALVRTLTLVATPVFISERMKAQYSMGHASRVDAMKEMGRDAWLKATNRSTRFPPDSDPGLLDWYEAEFAKSDYDVQLAYSRLVNGANAGSFLSDIRAPVLGLYPTDGPITSAEQEAMLLERLPGMTMVHLPTRYHMVHHIAPATCATELLHFVARHDGVACHEV